MDSDPSGSGRRPRFLCDAMLGSLARWLRLFGFDAEYPSPGPEDDLLARWAREESRWLLTKDRELAARGPRTVLIRGYGLEDQLVEVLHRLDLRPAASLESARCAECNGCLDHVAHHEVSDVVPPYVAATATRFRRCRNCGRIFWPGTHRDRIVARMRVVTKRVTSLQ